jgi:hypothetical protein
MERARDPDPAVRAHAASHANTLRESHRKHVVAEIINVIADEVDAARRQDLEFGA